jgi:adenosine deaminase
LSDRTWLRGLPKAELHVHLEGTTTPEAYARIARRNGLEVPSDPASLFHCNNFESFLNAFLQVVRALRRPEDFAEITASYLEQSARAGVRHVEFLFSPATFRHFFKGIDLEAIVAAIHQECARARATHGVSSLLIFDMVRNLGEDAAFADIDLALASRRYGVVGVGLGGDERKFPARDFRQAFERAERMGLRRTVHAGEADGRQSIVDAVELLHAERIGHGVAAAGEEDVLRLLRARGVAVDACLTSNTVTGAWNGRGVHPVGEFLRADVSVTLSSDDPSFFGASLLDEYERAAQHGLGRAEIIQLARNSFQSSFAPEKEKRAWLDELGAYLATKQARH